MVSSNLSLSSLFSVDGYVAVVTGGGTGIGYMIAEGLVQNGATVYITGRREGVLKEAADRLNAIPGIKGHAVPFTADVTSKEDAQNLVKFVEQREHSVDLLVNNAGTVKSEPATTHKSPLGDLQSTLSSASQEAWMDTFAANTWGPFVVTTAFLNLLGKAAEKGHGRGSVIIVTSVSARQWNPHHPTPAYGASKAAVEHFAKILAAQVHPYRIRVNVLAPGSFPSELNPATDTRAMAHPSHNHAVPLGRSGTAEDVAGTVIWLASRAGAYVTGTSVDVDGGVLLIVNSENKLFS